MPARTQFGIDLARSFALGYTRRAAAPILLLFLMALSWGLSGLALVGYDERAVYERFGAPVGVMRPGLHAILPWPFGRTRLIEFGAVHEEPLGGAALGPIDPIGAEAIPPPSLDRLWEQAHPGEMIFLTAALVPIVMIFAHVLEETQPRWLSRSDPRARAAFGDNRETPSRRRGRDRPGFGAEARRPDRIARRRPCAGRRDRARRLGRR